jgi:hypothetical protein
MWSILFEFTIRTTHNGFHSSSSGFTCGGISIVAPISDKLEENQRRAIELRILNFWRRSTEHRLALFVFTESSCCGALNFEILGATAGLVECVAFFACVSNNFGKNDTVILPEMSTEPSEDKLWRIATDHGEAFRRCGESSRSHARNVVVSACKGLPI